MHELNKYILHNILHNGILHLNEAPDLIKNIAEKLNIEQRDIRRIITDINENISKHLLRIDIRICEITSEKVCVIVNQTLDDLSKTPPNITPNELELLEKIFEEIMMSDSKNISTIVCLNLTSKIKAQISKDLAQQKIDTWCENGYLVNNNDGSIYLGPRAISEFEVFFKVQYANRMTTCKLCTDFVYFGKICGECNEVIHTHCALKHLSKKKTCPICKKTWTESRERHYSEEADSDDGTQQLDESMDTD